MVLMAVLSEMLVLINLTPPKMVMEICRTSAIVGLTMSSFHTSLVQRLVTRKYSNTGCDQFKVKIEDYFLLAFQIPGLLITWSEDPLVAALSSGTSGRQGVVVAKREISSKKWAALRSGVYIYTCPPSPTRGPLTCIILSFPHCVRKTLAPQQPYVTYLP